MKKRLVLYDAECGQCKLFALVVRAVDRGKRISLSPIADAEVSGLLGSVPEEERHRSFHVVLEGGRIVSGGEAVGELAGTLSTVCSLIFRTGKTKSLVSVLYHALAAFHTSRARAQ